MKQAFGIEDISIQSPARMKKYHSDLPKIEEELDKDDNSIKTEYDES